MYFFFYKYHCILIFVIWSRTRRKLYRKSSAVHRCAEKRFSARRLFSRQPVTVMSLLVEDHAWSKRSVTIIGPSLTISVIVGGNRREAPQLLQAGFQWAGRSRDRKLSDLSGTLLTVGHSFMTGSFAIHRAVFRLGTFAAEIRFNYSEMARDNPASLSSAGALELFLDESLRFALPSLSLSLLLSLLNPLLVSSLSAICLDEREIKYRYHVVKGRAQRKTFACRIIDYRFCMLPKRLRKCLIVSHVRLTMFVFVVDIRVIVRSIGVRVTRTV